MILESQVCAIVDAYSTGKFLARSFQDRGWKCIHIQSSSILLPFQRATFREEDFLESFVYGGNLEETLQALRKYDLICCIPGAESGVELADSLSENLGLFSNGTEFSKARRDKYIMTESLKSKGLRSVEHFKSDNLEAILSWVARVGRFPIVAKPLDSSGTDGVRVCYSYEEIVDAFAAIRSAVNRYGLKNQEVLVQTFLEGTEYIVNSVSTTGQHFITEIWRCLKRYQASAFVYDVEELLPSEGETQDLLVEYVCNVLDALSIKHGPTHAEVMLTEQGPVLIEMGARLHGSIDPHAITNCTGTNHVELTVDSYFSPSAFVEIRKQTHPLCKNCLCVALISKVSGKVEAIPGLDEVRKLPSFFSADIGVGVGDLLKETCDLASSPGIIYLVHEDKSLLWRDYQTIRNLESNVFFELAEHCC